jgi:signal peptidase II
MKRVAVLLAIAAGVLGLDQWTKHLATATLAGRPSVHLLDDVLVLTYALNSGVAFSLGAGTRFPFYLFSIAAAVVILWMFARGRVPRLGQQIALALILGGALGNLVDRISTGLVVDFIEVGIGRYRWPVFNVADSAVTVGVALFILYGPPRAERAAEPAPADAATSAPGEAATPPEAPHSLSDDVPYPGSIGDSAARGRAAGPLPGDRAGRPLA